MLYEVITKLIATGGSTGDDAKFNKEQKQKINENNLLDHFEVYPEFEGKEVNGFFKKVQMITVPVRIGEAFGMYLLEAMASGVPVVQPALGAFPEIIESSGGGVTYVITSYSIHYTKLYDFRPRLRDRLTLRRLPLLRKPW